MESPEAKKSAKIITAKTTAKITAGITAGIEADAMPKKLKWAEINACAKQTNVLIFTQI